MQHNENAITERRILFLDYLRIFAFLSVLIGHKFWIQLTTFASDPSVPTAPRMLANWLLPLVMGGGAGVVVFFFVSGYIITHILQTEKTSEFIIKRIFRIYPLYCFAVIIQHLTLANTDRQSSSLVLLQQLSLFGDLFSTPYSLNGAEWTLRLEIAFYVFMAILGKLGLVRQHKEKLPYIFLAVALLFGYLTPFSTDDPSFVGYFQMYFLFFFIGAAFYLYEIRQIKTTFLFLFVAFIFYQHYHLMAKFGSADQVYAVPAFVIFVIAWLFRRHMVAESWVLLLSNMTYAVYLFHNWYFDYCRGWLQVFAIPVFSLDMQALIALMLTCYIVTRLVESPGIKLGRFLLKKLSRKTAAPSA